MWRNSSQEDLKHGGFMVDKSHWISATTCLSSTLHSSACVVFIKGTCRVCTWNAATHMTITGGVMHRCTSCYLHLSWLSVSMAMGHALLWKTEASVEGAEREHGAQDDGQAVGKKVRKGRVSDEGRAIGSRKIPTFLQGCSSCRPGGQRPIRAKQLHLLSVILHLLWEKHSISFPINQ